MAHVRRLAEIGTPTMRPKGAPEWPAGTGPDALLAWLDPDARHARLCREIDANGRSRSQMTFTKFASCGPSAARSWA